MVFEAKQPNGNNMGADEVLAKRETIASEIRDFADSLAGRANQVGDYSEISIDSVPTKSKYVNTLSAALSSSVSMTASKLGQEVSDMQSKYTSLAHG